MYPFEKLTFRLNIIAQQVARHRHELPPFALRSAQDDSWQPLASFNYWGEWQQDFLLRGYYQIPEDWPLNATIALDLPLGDSGDGFNAHPEALITIDGDPFTTVDVRHNHLVLPSMFKDYAAHELLLDGWTGLGGSLWGDDRPLLYMRPAALVIIDDATNQFVVLARNALMVAQHLAADDPLVPALVQALTDAFNQVDTRHPIGDAFYNSIPSALDGLQQAVTAAGGPQQVVVHAAGHAHIDTAWLWTLAQTRRKAARSFYSALHLMARFPAYHFTQSQPQLYEFIREDHPDLFARIRTAVASGRWEPIGGMWVEADCNITGAESLVRQFLIGRRYFREHFGAEAETPVTWLPDTFGFPATLPQIMHAAGIPYFFTTKLRWNEHNDFPYDSFWWEGLDGTRVLAHITPTPMQTWLRMATYNAEANAQSLIETWQRMKHKTAQRRALMAYGWGDGGGGPTAEMLEDLAALKDFPGIPQVKQGRAFDFFHALEADSSAALPVWNGELYLETHQGTLTSQAWIKRANRKSEVLLHDAEYLATLARLHDPDFTYPQADLNDAWRLLLLNQFHDILPGSSIRAVYDDARQQFAALTARVSGLRDEALDRVSRRTAGDWLVVNTVDCARSGVITLAEPLAANQHITYEGQPCVTQPDGIDSGGTLVWLPGELPALGTVSLRREAGAHAADDGALIARPGHLENEALRVTFDADGRMTGVYDKRLGWDVLAPGAVGNQFQLFEDRPLRFDAWNIDPDYEARRWTVDAAESVTVVERGPVRATLRLVWRAMHSTITQYLSLYRGGTTLVARTLVDWQERHMLLKVAFPVNVRADTATYHIQWGSVQRPTHRSTPWDAARYEVAAHHWANLGHMRRGVALLNDCKYAYDIHEHVMRLTLLKSATYPDPEADRGTHEFTYALYPHPGDLGAVLAAGYDLNYPLLVRAAAGTDAAPGPLAYTEAGVTLETVKQAEDSSRIVLRFLAADPAGDTTTIRFGFPVKAAWTVNLLEEALAEIPRDAVDRVTVPVRRHQILTLLVEPEGGA
ncbi:MAG: alpha-mannosidase [Chloroflexota bacterium]